MKSPPLGSTPVFSRPPFMQIQRTHLPASGGGLRSSRSHHPHVDTPAWADWRPPFFCAGGIASCRWLWRNLRTRGSAACPSCFSMTASTLVSTGSGAGCSGTAAFSIVDAEDSLGRAASGIFFLSSVICKPHFHDMKKPVHRMATSILLPVLFTSSNHNR